VPLDVQDTPRGPGVKGRARAEGFRVAGYGLRGFGGEALRRGAEKRGRCWVLGVGGWGWGAWSLWLEAHRGGAEVAEKGNKAQQWEG